MARLNEARVGALLTEAFGVSFTRSAATALHAEHGTAVLVGVDADVVVGTVRARAVVVAPDVAYSAHNAGPTVSYTFDPELCPALAGYARARGGIAAIDDPRVAQAVSAHRASLTGASTLDGIGTEILPWLVGPAPRHDRRIAGLIEELREPEQDHRAAIAHTRLSRSHLAALFVRDVGLPIRTYLVWRRLLHALAHVGPLDMTAAAHAAGFADLAHFSRTCKRMLGYAPTVLRERLVTPRTWTP